MSHFVLRAASLPARRLSRNSAIALSMRNDTDLSSDSAIALNSIRFLPSTRIDTDSFFAFSLIDKIIRWASLKLFVFIVLMALQCIVVRGNKQGVNPIIASSFGYPWSTYPFYNGFKGAE